MKISAGRTDYTATEQEVCGLHLANKDEAIDSEYELIKAQFVATHRDFNRDDDFEFPDWHANIRMLWVYLYSDGFYAPRAARKHSQYYRVDRFQVVCPV